MSDDDLIRLWVATMVDKQLSRTSRKRYVEKLSAVYKAFLAEQPVDQKNKVTASPFDAVLALRDCEINPSAIAIVEQISRFDKIFDTFMDDAKSHPRLAVFIYLLLNASSDIEKAVKLKVDEYDPQLTQLDDIIDVSEFHHRRRYLFDLGQSRKRMSQLVREVNQTVNSYFLSKGIIFSDTFIPEKILSLWIAKARQIGISLSDIRSMFSELPDEYSYLEQIKRSELSPTEILHIKKCVAEAFSPSGDRWYAMKLRRSSSFNDLRDTLKTNHPLCFGKILFFYPMRETARKIGKRILRESTPYIPGIVFLKLTPRYVATVDNTLRRENIGWMFRLTNTPGSEFSIIDPRSMHAFQKAVGQFTSDMKIELTSRPILGIGREVRITGGVMNGYEGVIYDIKDSADGGERLFYIKLSHQDYVKIEAKIEEIFIEPLNRQTAV